MACGEVFKMTAKPNTLDPTSPDFLPHFIISARANAATAESGSFADSNVWQLIGVVEDLSIYEGVAVFREDAPMHPDENDGVVARVLIVCDPNTPAGGVLLNFATSIVLEAEQEAAHRERNDPNEDDFRPIERDWLWPLRRTLQLGGKLKEKAGSPVVQEQPSPMIVET